MADVNWHQYKCNLCLAAGLTGAAVASALITAVLAQAGMSVILLVILFLLIWGVLFKLVDRFCASSFTETDHVSAGRAAVGGVAVTDSSDEDLTGKSTEEVATKDEASANAKAAEEKAAADAKAAEEKAAADVKADELAEVEKAEAAAKEADGAAERAAEAKRAQAAGEVDFDADGVVEGAFEGTRPEALDGPRDGVADDLKRIKGVGPKMEILCNSLGFYHFDQIASWKPDEIAWVDANLEGFKGRVTRDEWVAQAKLLASGAETEFSKRVDEGDVPSSQ